MNLKKQSEDLKYVTAIEPKNSEAATINGNAINKKGFRSASFCLVVGIPEGTPTDYTVAWKIQEKELSGDQFADVSGLTGEITGASEAYQAGIIDANLEDRKTYVRVVAVVTFTDGTTPKIPIACMAVLGNPYTTPVTQD